MIWSTMKFLMVVINLMMTRMIGLEKSKTSCKDDINNATGFLALNPQNQHIWLAISGDRMETNGTSYIDFEFYQNEITRTGGPIPGGTGGFVTNGPHKVEQLVT
jgi:hypothetical protein